MQIPDWIVTDRTTDYARAATELNEQEKFFVENSARAECLVESHDPEACYSYDDYALCHLDGVYYVFNTNGCSCPDPRETWHLVCTGSKEQILGFCNIDADSSGFREFVKEARKVL